MNTSQGNIKKKKKSVKALSCSAYKKYSAPCFLDHKQDENHITLPSYTVFAKGIGKTDSFAWLSSFLQQPHALAG